MGWKKPDALYLKHNTFFFGFWPNSSVKINQDEINIKFQNLVGDRWNIFKNGDKIGNIDFSFYRYSTINLNRVEQDGQSVIDIFKVEEQGFSQIYILSQLNLPILKFSISLNPLRLNDKFNVEVLSELYSREAVEELIFYTGEILYRLFRPEV